MRVIYDIYSSYDMLIEGTPAEVAIFNRLLSNAKRVSIEADGNLLVRLTSKVAMAANLVSDTAKVLVPDDQATVG